MGAGRSLAVAVAAAAAVVLAGCTAGSTPDTTVPKIAPTAPPTTVPLVGSTAPAAGSTVPLAGSTVPLAGSTAAPGPAPAPAPAPAEQVRTGSVVRLAPGRSDEASGIAAATGTPDAYFLVDDGTGTDGVVAVGSDGEIIATIVVQGVAAGNAEALASGSCGSGQAETCLYIGDIGDNRERRAGIMVYRIDEPDLAPPPDAPLPSQAWPYAYPDGPHNAEAMLVAGDGSLLIITKPDDAVAQAHRMYRGRPGGGELVFVREFRPPAAERPLRTLFTGNKVTDAASGPGRVLLLTYDEVQEFTAPDPSADVSTFPEWPHRRVPMPSLPQAEGITAAPDGCGYTVASEAGPGGDAGSLAIVSCG